MSQTNWLFVSCCIRIKFFYLMLCIFYSQNNAVKRLESLCQGTLQLSLWSCLGHRLVPDLDLDPHLVTASFTVHWHSRYE